LTVQVSVKGGEPHSQQQAAITGRTLSPEEALVPVWVSMLRVHNAVVSQVDAELQEKHNLPLSSFEALLHLSHQPEQRMRLSALAESVVLTQSAISRLIDRLEKAGWVRREPYPGDGRGAYAVLTAEGLALVREVEVTHLAAVRAHFLDYLTDEERATLARVWERLLPGRRPEPECTM
jgi:DNA-binding MarR family transcriptional regulator